MTDDLKHTLAPWVAPAPSDAARQRIEVLLDDMRLPGPVRATRLGARVLPMAYGVVVSALAWSLLLTPPASGPVLRGHDVRATAPPVVTPGVPIAAQATATAVSTVELQGYELIQEPRIRVSRSGS